MDLLRNKLHITMAETNLQLITKPLAQLMLMVLEMLSAGSKPNVLKTL
jgi:hypothetical protein